MIKVKIIPKSKRAKDRVASHGEIMEFCKESVYRTSKGNAAAIYVKSLEKTSFGNEVWRGWFTFDEMDFERIEA